MQPNPAEVARDAAIEAACPSAPAGNRKNVVLVYIDALRTDVLQSRGGDVANMPFISERVAAGDLVQFPRVCSELLDDLVRP